MKRGSQNFEATISNGMGQEIAQLLSLSDDEKREMCLSLLDEFGAQNISLRGDEILHSCCLPNGLHSNGDRNPSANLNWRKMTYKCHGCGEGGGIAWFITTCRGGDLGDTKKWLSCQTSVGSSESLARLQNYIDSLFNKPVVATNVQIPEYDPEILKPWQFIHPWLTEIRGIPTDNIIQCRIGFDPESHRIVLPHFWKGALVGWQTRQLLSGDSPKYKNTPNFPKNETLYHAPDDQRAEILVVESVLSVAAKLHLHSGMVATFGASVTERQKHLLAAYQKVILWFDNDPAGWKATREVGEMLVRYTQVLVVQSDLAADPAEVDDDTFERLVSEAVPYSLWQQPSQLKEVAHGNP